MKTKILLWSWWLLVFIGGGGYLWYHEINPIVWIQEQFRTQSVYIPIIWPLDPSTYSCNQCNTDSDCDNTYGCANGVCLPKRNNTCNVDSDCFGSGAYMSIQNEIFVNRRPGYNGGVLAKNPTNASYPIQCNIYAHGKTCDNGSLFNIGNEICSCGNNTFEPTAGEQCDGGQNCTSTCQCPVGFISDGENGCKSGYKQYQCMEGGSNSQDFRLVAGQCTELTTPLLSNYTIGDIVCTASIPDNALCNTTLSCPDASVIIPQITQGTPGCPGTLIVSIPETEGFTAGRYDSNGNEIAEGWSMEITDPGNYTFHVQLNNQNTSPPLFCDYYPTVQINPEDFISDTSCSSCGDRIESNSEECDGGANCTNFCECPVGYEADPNSNGCVLKLFTPAIFNPLNPSTYVCGQCQSNNDCNAGETCRSSMCLPDLAAPCFNNTECYQGPVELNQLVRARQTSKITNTTIINPTQMECKITTIGGQGQCYLQGYNGVQGRNMGGNINLCQCGNGIVEVGTNEQCDDGSPSCTTSCQCAPGYELSQSGSGCTPIQNNDPEMTYAREIGNRSPCSALCGGGIQSRNVQCKDSNGIPVADTYCIETKPSTTQPCNTQACPVDTDPEPVNTYSWYIGEFSVCDKQCGGGTKTRLVECRDQNNTPVSSSLCPGLTPPSTETCNTQACPVDTDPEPVNTYSWYHGDFGQCTKECGGGQQSRRVECRDQEGLMVADSFCPTLTKPVSTQPCNTQACIEVVKTKPGSWMIGLFGSCDKECGGGIQTRTVQCKDEDGKLLSDTQCPAPKPTTQQSCNTQPCATTTTPNSIETYKRTVGNWSQCTKACGGGEQTRSVVCTDSKGNTVENDLCTEKQPVTKQTCNTAACIINGACDIEFGLCAAGTLGNGNFYSCDDPSTWTCFGEGAGATNAYCSIENDPCERDSFLQYRRQATQVGGCSELCEGGIQSWAVNCVDTTEGAIVEERFCTHLPKPPVETPCNPQRCTQFTRYTYPRSTCNKPCNEGISTRQIECRNERNEKVDASFCDPLLKPEDKQNCNLQTCPEDVDKQLFCGPLHQQTIRIDQIKLLALQTNKYDFCPDLTNTQVTKEVDRTKPARLVRSCPYDEPEINYSSMINCEAYIASTTCGYADQQEYLYFFNGSDKYPTAFCAEEDAVVVDYQKTDTGRSRGCEYPGLVTTVCEAMRAAFICEEQSVCMCAVEYQPGPTPPNPGPTDQGVLHIDLLKTIQNEERE